MGFYDNSLNLEKLLKGIQANSLLVNRSSFNLGTDLTVKQPTLSMPNLNNIQAAYSSAYTIGSIFGSSQSTTNPLSQFTSMMPQMNAMASSGLFSMPTMPSFSSAPSTPSTNIVGTFRPPSITSSMVGIGAAMGMIDPSLLGMGTSTSTAQTTSSATAALIKKMPVVSAAKTAEILTKPTEKQMMWGGVNQNVSLLTSDGSGITMLNAALPNPEDKASFMNSLSSNIDKEVRLAGRGASKEVVAEVLANELYNLYLSKNKINAEDMERNNKGYKEKVINGLKSVCMGDAEKLDANTLQQLSQVLPSISNKEMNPNNVWNTGFGGFGGMMGIGKFGGGMFNTVDQRVTLLENATNSLTATAKENLIKKNSIA